MTRTSFSQAVALTTLAALTLAGCGPGADARQHDDDHDHEHAELAEPMSRMQYYSQKLGYAIQAENGPLAAFYLHELEELTEEIREEIPDYEGLPIAALLGQLLAPALDLQHEALESGDWQAARQRYHGLIQTCNSCHAATEHAFIQITPAEGEPPFNQRFDPGG